jgi:hypothetical protein
MPDIFPAGAIVYMRTVMPDGGLARIPLLKARDLEYTVDGHFIVLDAERKALGVFPEDFVAAFLPLETTGPAANAQDSPSRPDHPSEPSAQGNRKTEA